MKEGIHPKYEQTTIRSACGISLPLVLPRRTFDIEICSSAAFLYQHRSWLTPVDRVDRFNKRV